MKQYMLKTYKKALYDKVTSFLSVLQEINKIPDSNIDDKKLRESFETTKKIVFNGISNIQSDLRKLKKETEWERLNIAFVGETNSGKSTIIEGLTEGNGSTIGEGRKDFTKVLKKVLYKNVNLIDTPGIEGWESDASTKQVDIGIKKAHIIFYVIGTNKEPEEETLMKLKELMQDNAKIFTVMNLRGKPTVYKYKNLVEKSDLEVEERIKSRCYDIFGKHYYGNIMVNGYIGFLVSGSKKEKRFIPDREKALTLFKKPEEAKNFSRIEELEKTIENVRKNVIYEIIISNTYKFLRGMEVVLSSTLKEKRNFDKAIKEANNQISKYLKEVENIKRKYEIEIENHITKNLNALKSDYKSSISKAIEYGKGKNEIQSELKRINEEKTEKINKDINEIINLMRTEIEGKIKEFQNRITMQIKFIDIKEGKFKVEEILKKLQVSSNYIFEQIKDTLWKMMPDIIIFTINRVLGIVAFIVDGVKKIWEWFFGGPDRRKANAKQKANEEIEKTVSNIKSKIEREFKDELKQIEISIEQPVNQLQKAMKSVKNISLELDEKIAAMSIAKKDLCLLVASKVMGKKIDFVYIDLSLSSLIVAGIKDGNYNEKEVTSNFRVKKSYIYSSIQEWIRKNGEIVSPDIFRVRDEFNYRAFSVLLADKKYKAPFKRIQKELQE